MDSFERSIFGGSHVERHVLHDDALGDEAPGHGADPGHVEELVYLELGQLLVQSVGLGLAHARGQQVQVLLDVCEPRAGEAAHAEHRHHVAVEAGAGRSDAVVARVHHKRHLRAFAAPADLRMEATVSEIFLSCSSGTMFTLVITTKNGTSRATAIPRNRDALKIKCRNRSLIFSPLHNSPCVIPTTPAVADTTSMTLPTISCEMDLVRPDWISLRYRNMLSG